MFQEINYEDELPVKVQVLEIEQIPWHTHNDIQIVYVLEGEIELKLTYARYRLSKNNIHIIHNEDVHGFRALSGNNLVVILSLNVDYFSARHPSLDSQVFTTKVSENIATYKKQLALKFHMFSIISELHNRKRGYKNRIMDTAHTLIDSLYSDFRGFTVNHEKRTFEHQVSRDPVQMERISRVVTFVYSNYPYKLGLSSIAEAENINSYYLSHLFQRFVGDSFRNFVSMVRVEMSEVELLTTDHSIAHISSNVGFSNAKYYLENFIEWFGCHPKEYRQLYGKEILGRAKNRFRQLPLDSINDVIESYNERPAFTGASQQVMSASLDFRKIKSGRHFGSNAPDISPGEFYSGYDAQQDCLDVLKSILKCPESAAIPQASVDSENDRRGTLTFNGMKKPLYYLRHFLLGHQGTIGSFDDWYLMTLRDEKAALLFFNDDTDTRHDMEFNFFNMPGRYQITEHRLCSDSTCLSFWKQLDFKANLSDGEMWQILQMSAPRLSWKTVDSSGSFTYSASLDPHDIMLAEIKKL